MAGLTNPSQILSQILRGSGWFLAGRAASDAARLARILVVAAIAAPATLGTVAAALFVTSCAETLTELGFGASVVHAGERRREALGAILSAQLTRALIVGVGIWLSAPTLESWFAVPRLAWTLRALVLLLIAKGAANPAAALLGRDGRYGRLVALSAVDSISSVGVLLLLLGAFSPLQALVVALVAGQVLRTVGSYVITELRPTPTVAFRTLGSHLRFGRWMMAAQVVVFLSLQGDNAVVAKVLGATALGVYQVAFRLAEIPTLLSSAIVGQAAFPAFSRIGGDRQQLRAEFFSLQRGLLIANAGLCAVIWMAGHRAVQVLFGPEWAGAADLLPLLLSASLLRGTLALGGWVFLATGLPQWNFAMNAIRLAGFGVAVLPLAFWFGSLGVAAAVALGSISALPVYVYGIRRALGGSWREHFVPVPSPSTRAVTPA